MCETQQTFNNTIQMLQQKGGNKESDHIVLSSYNKSTISYYMSFTSSTLRIQKTLEYPALSNT
jgi:hypothetical protein